MTIASRPWWRTVSITVLTLGLVAGPSAAARAATQTNPPWNLDRIDQATGTNGTFNYPNRAGNGVNVYVLSTGINVSHSEFGGRAVNGPAFCLGCPANIDDNGTGTHLASIVGGTTFGVAKKVNIIGVKTHPATGIALPSDLVAGMSYVLEQHKRSSNKNTIVMVAAYSTSQAVNGAAQNLIDNGIHVVAPVGDVANGACGESPGSVDGVIAVGATNDMDQVAVFSNFGPCLDLFAPGVSIAGAGITSDTAQRTASGTRQAAAHVAGAIALIISKRGNMAPSTMAAVIENQSTKNVLSRVPGDTPNRMLRTEKP